MRVIYNNNKIVTVSGNALYIDDTIPDYVKTEADATIFKAQSHGTLGRTIRFIACSDSHNDGAGKASSATTTQLIQEGNKHCGQAIQYISNRIGLDFIAFLGDATWAAVQAASYTQSDLITDIMQFNSYIGDGFRGAKQIRCVGNHDQFLTQTDSARLGNIGAYGYFGRYCFGEKQNPAGYGYIDYPEVNTRVIYLNTSDITPDIQSVAGTKLNISAAQVSWLQSVLADLASKTGWKCLILSHAPLDLLTYSGNPVSSLLLPYSNSVQILANVHGHVHCYSYGYMSEKIRRFTIPNCCFADNNHYHGRAEYAAWADDVTYNKTQNTGDDTAFSLVTIDLDSNMCYVDNYGAGIDREFSCDYYAPSVLLDLDRTYVAGTTGGSIATSLDESKAYTNVASTGVFNSSASTASGVSTSGVTVNESGIGGIFVAYPVELPNKNGTYKLSFDFSGSGKCRAQYRLCTSGGSLGSVVTMNNDTSGASGNKEATISANGYEWLIVFLSSNTSQTKTYSNVTLEQIT